MITRLLTLLIAACLNPPFAVAQIRHLELGAANYDVIQAHRAFGRSMIDDGNEGHDRFRVLDQTLRDLIKAYGPEGTIFLNDFNEKGLDEAAAHALRWLEARGYNEIEIVLLPGDYRRITLPSVESMNLTNPENTQLPLPRKQSGLNQIIFDELSRVAKHSRTGLVISTYFNSGNQDVAAAMEKFVLPPYTTFTRIKSRGYTYHTFTGKNWRKIEGITSMIPAKTSRSYRLVVDSPADCGRYFHKPHY